MKQMLYVSLLKSEDKLELLFEIEKFYKNSERQVYTGQLFADLSFRTISEDLDGLDRLGFKILNGLLSPRAYRYEWALAIYTGRQNIKNTISLDEELYRENIERKHCGYMALKNREHPRENIHIDEQRMLAALKVLQYLPLEE